MKIFYGDQIIGQFANMSDLPARPGYVFRAALKPDKATSSFTRIMDLPYSPPAVDMSITSVHLRLMRLRDSTGHIQEWACELLADPWLAPRLPGWRPEIAGMCG